MSGQRIDDDVVRWAIGGRHCAADEAIAALAERPLLLLMHGYGSFEGDLIELAPRLPGGFVCASPRAPFVAPAPIENGFAWWQLPAPPGEAAPVQRPARAEFVGGPEHEAAVTMLEWLDATSGRVAAATGSQLGAVAPMGFSQGGAMVTSMLRLRPERFACGVVCSGFVAGGDFAGDARLARLRPPLFWGRDTADPIIDQARVDALAAWAPRHTTLEARLYDGIEHGIGPDELADVSSFLRRHVDGAER